MIFNDSIIIKNNKRNAQLNDWNNPIQDTLTRIYIMYIVPVRKNLTMCIRNSYAEQPVITYCETSVLNYFNIVKSVAHLQREQNTISSVYRER